jgi:hypothetical protein
MKPLEITANDGTELILVDAPNGELWKLGLGDPNVLLELDKKIPKDAKQILGTFNTKTNEFSFGVNKDWVEKSDNLFIDYILFKGHLQNYCETKEESFSSLIKYELKKANIVIPETVLIIEKILK